MFFIDLEAFANSEHISNTTGKNFQYLNAYNAPHWMNIGAEMQYQGGRLNPVLNANGTIMGWDNTQVGTTMKNVETYGTSWMRDLMEAAGVARSSALPGSQYNSTYTFLFNGAVDANHGMTPFMHGTHDLGMAFDLGVSSLINESAFQSKFNEPLTLDAESLANTLFDPAHPEKGSRYDNIPDWNAYDQNKWSYTNAVYLSNFLSDDPLNNQKAAMQEFLSLYALTQGDGITGNGTWDDLPVKNDGARAALFGNGSMLDFLSQVHIGGGRTYTNSSGQIVHENPYLNINEILGRLGILSTPVAAHQNHFHVFLNPPAVKEIGVNHLLADASLAASADTITTATLPADTQGLLDYTQTLVEGEEFMFTMDVPYVPVQDTPIVLAQAAAPDATTQPDYLLKACEEKPSAGGLITAMNMVSPADLLATQIGNRSNRYIDPATTATIKITLLQGTTHGKLIPQPPANGRVYYEYRSEPGYEGQDQVVFMAEFEGKRYKIVIDLIVSMVIDENSPQCPPAKLIKVNGKPVSGSSTYDLNSTVNIAALDGVSIGQTLTNPGEELMFTMDVPYVPAQDTPIVLAQAAATGGGTPQPDYLLKTCGDVQSYNQTTAMNGVDPAYMVAGFLDNRDNRFIEPATVATIKLTLLEGTTHGKLVPHTRGDGGVYYMYEAPLGYKGKDRAVFMAEFEGKTYKVVIDLNVYPVEAIADNMPSTCPPPTLIRVNGKPVSGSTSYDLNSIPVTFSDITGSVLGQTNASSITLDTTASGYGWFIDPTPADNSEFLPTSNPYEWVAKAGSAAAGKMDMLSVLLHEYGHALGIDHSTDPNDYMGTTLPLGGLSFAFAGLLRSNRYGGTSIDLVPTQYAVAASDVDTPSPLAREQTCNGVSRGIARWAITRKGIKP